AVAGAFLVNYAKTYFTGALPDVWLFALGAVFIVVTVFMPKGVVGLLAKIKTNKKKITPDATASNTLPQE
ncbi:MAG: urea ABC transporter permease subunit UrtC, partial [Gammaproteobacteria bacterium]